MVFCVNDFKSYNSYITKDSKKSNYLILKQIKPFTMRSRLEQRHWINFGG